MQKRFRTSQWIRRLSSLVSDSVADAVVEKDLSGPPSSHARPGDVHEIDLDDIRRLRGTGADRPDLMERLSHSFGVIAFSGGEFAGFCWATGEPRREEGVGPFLYPVSPRDGSAYVYDLFVEPAHRRGGRGAALLEGIFALCTERGYHSAFFTHDAANVAMATLAKRLGMVDRGCIRYERTLAWKRTDLRALRTVSQ